MLAQNRAQNSRAMVTARLLLKKQFAGALCGLHYSLDERDAKLPFLQFHDAVNGTSRGRCHRVFQKRRVIAGFQDDAGSSFHGLRSQKGGDVAGKPDFHTGLGEGFQDYVGEGGAASGKAGDRIHVLFVDDDGAADGVEHGFRNLEVLRGCVRAATDPGHAAANGGAGVGHNADDGNLVANALLDVGGGHGSSNRNDERVFAKFRFDLFEDVANDLRFDAKKHNVGIFDGSAIVGGNRNAEFFGEIGGFLLVANCSRDALHCEQALFKIGAKKDSSEFAGA